MNISIDVHVHAPTNVVWATATDLASAPERISAIKRLEIITDGPIGKGTRFRETRIMFKRESTEEMEIKAWDPPRSYAIYAYTCGSHFTTTVSCEPDPRGGTTLRMTTKTVPVTLLAKLAMPLGKIMGGACIKMLRTDLENIKRAAEGAPAAMPA